MRNKKIFIIAVFILSIGFAAVSTTLYFNGTVNIVKNNADFIDGVIFSSASINEGSASISNDGKSITYSTKDLMEKNESATLNFTIENNSTQYNAIVGITCTMSDESNEGNEYISIEPDRNEYQIPSGGSITGNIVTTLNKVSISTMIVQYECTLNATAGEK